MAISRTPKKKLKSTAAAGKKKPAGAGKKKPAATAKKKSVAAGKKKSAATAKKKPVVAAKKKSVVAAKKKPAAVARLAEDTDAVQGSQAAFQRFLPQARALAEDQVKGLRFDPELAYYNVRLGVAALMPHHDMLKIEVPCMDLGRLFKLPELGQALVFAASQAAADPGAAAQSEPALRELLGEGYQLRGQLFTAADTLAAFGLVPASTVAKIRKGTGGLDTARDLSDLAALYSKYRTAFVQNTPATAAQAKRAAELGSILLARLSPKSARRARRGVMRTEAVSDRDRLATLLVLGHRDLRRVGYWVWGDEFDAHVPPLLARARPRKKGAGAQPSPPA